MLPAGIVDILSTQLGKCRICYRPARIQCVIELAKLAEQDARRHTIKGNVVHIDQQQVTIGLDTDKRAAQHAAFLTEQLEAHRSII